MPGVNSVKPVEMLRILRICYMHPPSVVVVDAAAAAVSVAAAAAAVTDAAAESAPAAANGEPAAAGLTAGGGGGGARRSSSATPVSYETFTPELVRDLERLAESPTPPPPLPPGADCDHAAPLSPIRVVERMEMMKETFSKVIAFLRNTGKC